MKFILVEDLETDLQLEEEQKEQVTTELIELFEENDFTSNTTVNGINFESTVGDIYASFYIDNNLNYKGYVTDKSINKSNYSVKGQMSNVLNAANKFINFFLQNI